MSKKSSRRSPSSRDERRASIEAKQHVQDLPDLPRDEWMRIVATPELVKWSSETQGPHFRIGDEYEVRLVGQYRFGKDSESGARRLTEITSIDFIQVRQEDQGADSES